MYPVIKKRVLNETVTLMEIEAPLVARKALPGQFIIFRIDEEGERVPLTIAGYDRENKQSTVYRAPDLFGKHGEIGLRDGNEHTHSERDRKQKKKIFRFSQSRTDMIAHRRHGKVGS